MLILTIVEFKTGTLYGYNKVADNESFVDVHSIPDSVEDKDEIDRRLRRDALRGIINRMKGMGGLDGLGGINGQRDYIHDRYSLPDEYKYKDDEDGSESSAYPYSYPITPKTRAKLDYPMMFPFNSMNLVDEEFPDNVYADSKPPNPLKNKNVKTVVRTTQTFARETIHGDSFNINEDYFENENYRNKKVKHRKRRNPYYNEVDDEDDNGFFELEAATGNKLGIIYEEDEHGRKVRKSVYYESDSDYDDPSQVPITRPDPKAHGFNEHSIMGEFDKDEKGNIILLTNEKGNLVCKNGRKVNEKGYLRDRFGHILYATKGRVRAFSEKDLDERGEIPLPFSYDRYNFNIFDVIGNIATNPATGSPKKFEHRRGESITDENGFLVNSKGYLVDSSGNIISRTDGEIKLDKWQLTKESDIPTLYTYDARRFNIRQCMGEFDRDDEGHIVILSEFDGNNKLVDKQGRLVNQKGYLVDSKSGNVVTNEGVILFYKQELGPGGEIPKIMPYTKFNVDEIRGDLEKDDNGKIIVIHENEKGEILDNQKRRVNAKGYLIDNQGNILDQKGHKVFDNELIDENGEIPKVFRIGLLRSDSTTSLNRFLEELEKIKHNLGLDDNVEDSNFEEEEKLLENSDGSLYKSKHSSENNSAMGDRPDNYNTANMENIQNFMKKKDRHVESSLSSDDFDVEDPEFLEAIKERKIKRRRVKHKYKKPNKKDIMLANAYGGLPRGAKVEKDPKLTSARSSKNKLPTVGAIAGNTGSRVTRYDPRQGDSIPNDNVTDNRRPDTKSSRKTLDVETKLNSKMGGDTRHGKMMDESELGLNSIMDEQNLKGLGSTIMLENQNQEIASQESSQRPRAKSKPTRHQKRDFTRRRGKKGKNKDMVSVAPSDLDKLYGKDVDDFLNESDWDINSDNNKSQMSYKSARSYGDKRIRGLESIYLQRLEAGVKKRKAKNNKKKPRFRALQDRYLNEDEIPRDDDYTSSIFSEDKNKKDSYFD